jgi:hypothetical protein
MARKLLRQVATAERSNNSQTIIILGFSSPSNTPIAKQTQENTTQPNQTHHPLIILVSDKIQNAQQTSLFQSGNRSVEAGSQRYY